ncbi:hypothetical protein M430DRAFT_203612 [Amorphotheca resinae ATCC 22711]|uniref:Uncharacterized protein n=1 Tax=Amorphotheca resinae ATCC 22711 TaxID=857342 RepID=A0A2T3BB76_AMORE|nr:hypothetical protein M430DRAFT_203612 [Amorphotheca resinae ATCC 22711]PSS25540.1 hypothetical protein M430DRAFT_203612 [Amorphotheca resinae ATCC 22711]
MMEWHEARVTVRDVSRLPYRLQITSLGFGGYCCTFLVTVDIGGLVVELLLCISYSLLNSAIGVTRTHTHTLALHQSASPLAVLLRLLPTLSKNQKIKKSQSELLDSPRPILSAFPYIPPVENLPSIIAKKESSFPPNPQPEIDR